MVVRRHFYHCSDPAVHYRPAAVNQVGLDKLRGMLRHGFGCWKYQAVSGRHASIVYAHLPYRPRPCQDLSGSGITSNIYICLLGLLTACWSLIGYDAAAHLTEETKSADQTAGWPMLYAIGASFLTGLIYLLALTICAQVGTELLPPSLFALTICVQVTTVLLLLSLWVHIISAQGL